MLQTRTHGLTPSLPPFTHHLQWLMLDGPVDTLWIESMNTVMDDNKTLTLINGDRIGMTETMSLLFEVQDLAVASPATVSRAGMVYIDDADLGWSPFVRSWLTRYFPRGDAAAAAAATSKGGDDGGPEPFSLEGELLSSYFNKYVPRLLRFKRKECRELVPMGDFHAVVSFCNLLQCIWAAPDNGLGAAAYKTATDGGIPALAAYTLYTERWFVFALVWSIGAVCDEAGRKKFNEAMREAEPIFPPVGSIYDYFVDPVGRDFKPWVDRVSTTWRPPKDMPFAKLTVPTVDTVRNLYIVHALVSKGFHVLTVGNTGTGKTVLCQQELDGLRPETHTRLSLYFSSATTSHTVQEIIEGSLEKRSKNKMGPPASRQLVVFVDDLNMPRKDTFGSQPPLELLRQWIDYGGWYDRGKQAWRYIVDMQLLAAMGPPGGGRNVISERLQSRFNMINVTFPTDKVVRGIFESILSSELKASGLLPSFELKA